MRWSGWLVVSGTTRYRQTSPLYPSVRLVKQQPKKLNPSEVAIELNLVLPDSLFKRPRIVTTVTIPDDAVPAQIISEAVIGDIRDAVRQVTEMDVQVRLVSSDDLHVPGVPSVGEGAADGQDGD